MIFARLRPAAIVLALGLLAGCRSEQVAFTFSTPVGAGPGALARAARPAPPAAEPLPATVPVAEVEAVPAGAPEAAVVPPVAQYFGGRQRVALASALRPAALPLTTLLRLRPHRRATGALARTQHTTEAGLGRTVLFILGVVLGVLAGLAALVNLIFGVGFFTALGYAAAGLVVLFLLYELFAPKKKA